MGNLWARRLDGQSHTSLCPPRLVQRGRPMGQPLSRSKTIFLTIFLLRTINIAIPPCRRGADRDRHGSRGGMRWPGGAFDEAHNPDGPSVQKGPGRTASSLRLGPGQEEELTRLLRRQSSAPGGDAESVVLPADHEQAAKHRARDAGSTGRDRGDELLSCAFPNLAHEAMGAAGARRSARPLQRRARTFLLAPPGRVHAAGSQNCVCAKPPVRRRR
jgi:hypothetical protein